VPSSLREQIEQVPFWWHSIPIDGLTTPGTVSPERQREFTRHWPDVRGKTVLDIGAYDGYFSFEAEARGASRVVALDHFVWERDIAGCMAYWRNCNERGTR
jgi:tRNA (mo5U34)-methyltransferase